MVKKFIKFFIFALFLVFLIYIRVFISQYREYKKAEEFYNQNNFKNAVVYYETAIQFYTPLSPYIEKSINRLIEIGIRYEQNQQYEYALDVYENLRSALYATKSFYQPYSNVIHECDRKISFLLRMIKQ